ncbi:MAG: surface carbohydrate biosynthesis protein [Planctomycetota bacterium]
MTPAVQVQPALRTRLDSDPGVDRRFGSARPRPRVALVVDHPLRDLPGLILVARRLCEQGCEVLTVPANLIEREVWSASPDLVLFNYLRRAPHLSRLYRALQRAGVAVGVLDTEGGVMESPDAFVRDLVTNEQVRRTVACYCTWGPVLAEHLRERGVFSEDQLFVTGCPRTDYYAEPWRDAVFQRETPALAARDRLVLLNTNFSLVNPAMLSRERQLSLMVETLGHSRDRVAAWQDAEEHGMLGLAKLAGEIARSFPEATVVLRPHPFERLETYSSLLPELPNLYCVREGAIEPWLMNAQLVIQRSCSTSIEAAMVGVPAASPNWLPTAFERPAANATSIPCQTPAELMSVVGSVLERRHALPLDVARASEQVIRDWYLQIDGMAHHRVADAILNSLPVQPRIRRERACRWGAYTGGRHFPHKRWLEGCYRRILGSPPSVDGRHTNSHEVPAKVSQWDNSLKRFGGGDVLALLQAANWVAGVPASDPNCELSVLAEDQWIPHQRTLLLRPTK